jgi:hypothetical protein
MDRRYIDNEHIVDRYLSGDLTVREAREFEKYCLEHPDFLSQLPIPVRLKARLARQPAEGSETGMFKAIPSSATHVAVAVADEGFDADEDGSPGRSYGSGGVSRPILFALSFALLAAIGGMVAYGRHATSLSEELRQVQREARATQMQAPAGVQTHRLQLTRQRPERPTLSLGWLTPPQLLELHIDAKEHKQNAFQITIDKVDGGRIMQIRRIAKDSNRELRLSVNSSAFGPGELLLKFDGYNWRGQTEEVGWVRLELK